MNYLPEKDLLSNRVILVTGASDGIGKEAARCYAEHGAEVIALGRSEEKLSRVEQEINAISLHPITTMAFNFSLAQPSDYQQLAVRIGKKFSHLDGLLHSAGLLGNIAPIEQQDPLIWQQVMQINVNAQFMLTQALLPLLLKSQSPSLIFTSSSVGRRGRAHWGAYSVSKFATEGLMQVLADEYPASTLRVNCINPGATRTAMRASAFPQEDPNKLRPPVEIMSPYLYLMGPDSKDVTGTSVDAQPDRKPGISR
jgi:NAD(P)-dependent dehydrogenase (short-subunit alcohol dehydrogenase family)